ncbi:hypothetical protein Ancab_040168 [Ancistrocladus abbreviatus]
MHPSLSMAVPLACAVAVLGYWIWRLFNWVWLKPKKLETLLTRQGLRGNSYRLLFGDTKDLSRFRAEARSKPINFTNDYLHRVNPLLHHTINNYGTNSFIWMGPKPLVTINEPKLIREAFSKMYNFQKPRLDPLTSLLVPGLGRYVGEKWVKHQKLITPAFHIEKLKLMLPAFYTSCNEMVNNWGDMVSETGSCELDVWPYLTTLTADVISRAAFSSSYEEGKRIFELLQEQIELTFQAFQRVYIPGWSYLPTRANKHMKELNNEIQALLRGMIDKRLKAMEAGEDPKDDLLGTLMESTFQEIQHGSKHQNAGMTMTEVIDECKLFYFAGQETTSVLLVWTMILLSKHQVWQARARDEVLRTFGCNQPDFDGLNHLKVVTMILYEVLRLYPPVISLRRTVSSDTQLGKLSLPAGVQVNLALILAHQDNELWGEDAKEFNPERFSKGISKAAKRNVSFFPFGWGPRICIGQNFALLEAKMALTLILQRFSFELSPSYAHAPATIMTLKPQFGAHIILHRL